MNNKFTLMKSIMFLIALFVATFMVVLSLIFFTGEVSVEDIEATLSEPKKLTLESFDIDLPVTDDPQVKLELAYKMMNANRAIAALQLLKQTDAIYQEQNHINGMADVQFAYGVFYISDAMLNYRKILNEIGITGKEFYKSKKYFEKSIELYKQTNNQVALAYSYYALGRNGSLWTKSPFLICPYYDLALETAVKAGDTRSLNRRYTFKQPLFTKLVREKSTYYLCDKVPRDEKYYQTFAKPNAFVRLRGRTDKPKNPQYEVLRCSDECQRLWARTQQRIKLRVGAVDDNL